MTRSIGHVVAAFVAIVVATGGCAELGYRSRVLARSPSPDGQVVAVCQEIPEFDGPGYDVRLERPDGTRVRRLYRTGDSGGCVEIVWSPDGALVAVLAGFFVQVTVVDVRFSMANLTRELWDARRIHQMTLGAGSGMDRSTWRVGQNLRFVGDSEIAVESCAYADLDVAHHDRTWQFRCAGPVEGLRLALSPELQMCWALCGGADHRHARDMHGKWSCAPASECGT